MTKLTNGYIETIYNQINYKDDTYNFIIIPLEVKKDIFISPTTGSIKNWLHKIHGFLDKFHYNEVLHKNIKRIEAYPKQDIVDNFCVYFDMGNTGNATQYEYVLFERGKVVEISFLPNFIWKKLVKKLRKIYHKNDEKILRVVVSEDPTYLFLAYTRNYIFSIDTGFKINEVSG